jgi:hypothetical protein
MNDSSPDMGVNSPDDPSLQDSPSSSNPKNYKPRRFLLFFLSFFFLFFVFLFKDLCTYTQKRRKVVFLRFK